MVLLTLTAIGVTAGLSCAGMYKYLTREPKINELYANFQKQEYLSARYADILRSARNLKTDNGKCYIFAKNPAQIISKEFEATMTEIIADLATSQGKSKMIYDKTTYGLEYKSSDIMNIVKKLDQKAKVDESGVYVQSHDC